MDFRTTRTDTSIDLVAGAPAGRLWWMSTLFFWQGNLLQSWQCIMEPQEDTRCFSLRRSERQGHPDRLNWIDLSLFGLCSAGLPSPGSPLFTKSSYKRGRGEKGKKIGKRASG